jgi:hypothetical protein
VVSKAQVPSTIPHWVTPDSFPFTLLSVVHQRSTNYSPESYIVHDFEFISKLVILYAPKPCHLIFSIVSDNKTKPG